jgi:hypothetical protein
MPKNLPAFIAPEYLLPLSENLPMVPILMKMSTVYSLQLYFFRA